MPLIKHANSKPLMTQATVLDLGDLDRQAKRIVESAREKAQAVLDDAQREAQQMIEQADAIGHEQGFQRGKEEGREQGMREGREQVIAELKPQLEQLCQSWTDALSHWETKRNEMLLAAREDVLAFAVAMGEKIVFRTLEVDCSIIEDQLAEALSLLSQPSSVMISINPQDRTLVEEVLPDLLRNASQCKQAIIRDDEAITRGGCVLSTAGGAVDATIETQLDRIVEAILPWMRDEPLPPQETLAS